MQRIHQAALDIVAKYDDDKFDRHIGYLKSNLHKADLTYLLNTRRNMREHGCVKGIVTVNLILHYFIRLVIHVIPVIVA